LLCSLTLPLVLPLFASLLHCSVLSRSGPWRRSFLLPCLTQLFMRPSAGLSRVCVPLLLYRPPPVGGFSPAPCFRHFPVSARPAFSSFWFLSWGAFSVVRSRPFGRTFLSVRVPVRAGLVFPAAHWFLPSFACFLPPPLVCLARSSAASLPAALPSRFRRPPADEAAWLSALIPWVLPRLVGMRRLLPYVHSAA